MIQSKGFLGRFLGPFLKTGLPLIKNVIKPLGKSALIPLGLTATAPAADAGIHKEILGSRNNNTTTLIITNDEMEDIIKIVKSLEYSGLLLKGVSETLQNEAKKQKGGFLSMLLGTLGVSLLVNILAGKGINRAGEGVVSVLKNGFLMPPRPLTNFEIQKYYQNKPKLNGVYSRDNLLKINDGAYVLNLDEYSDIGTHWVALYVWNNDITYFDSFGVEHIPKEIKAFIYYPLSIKTNTFRIKAYDSILWGYFCIGIINFMREGKTSTSAKVNNIDTSSFVLKTMYDTYE